MTALLLLFQAAFAGESRLAGLAMDRLAELHLGVPTYTIGDDSWRAPAPGGWVLHTWLPDDEAAADAFRFAISSVQRQLPLVVVVGADEARGDEGLVVARRGNVVLTVRADHAPAFAAEVLAAEVPEPATPWTGPAAPNAADPPRDPFGRRR